MKNCSKIFALTLDQCLDELVTFHAKSNSFLFLSKEFKFDCKSILVNKKTIKTN